MSGVTWSRNEKDERLLELINTYTSKLVIFDARPHLNAQANRVNKIFIETNLMKLI